MFTVAERVATDKWENGYLKVVAHPYGQPRFRVRIELPRPGAEEGERLHQARGQRQAKR